MDVQSELNSCGGCTFGRFDDVDEEAGEEFVSSFFLLFAPQVTDRRISLFKSLTVRLCSHSCTTMAGVTEDGAECRKGACTAYRCRAGWLLEAGRCEGKRRSIWG